MKFFCCMSETDHGAVGEGQSLKDILTIAGANTSHVVFTAPKNATVNYPFLTNITIPSTVLVEIEPGAMWTGTATITIQGEIRAGRFQFINGPTVTISSDVQKHQYKEWVDGTHSGLDSSPSNDDYVEIIDDPAGTAYRRLTTLEKVADLAGAGNVEDDVYGAGWNGDTTHAPSQNAVYDKVELLDAAKSDTSHDHDADYSGIAHDHDADYSDIAHDHDADYADIADGVTNGDAHNHSGGDGGQIAHTALSSIGANTHAQLDTFKSDLSSPLGLLIANGDGTFGEVAGVKCISQYSNSILTAVTAIGATKTILYVDANNTITVDTEVPSNIELRFIPGKYITVNTTIKLTINRWHHMVPTFVFSCAASAYVEFVRGACPYVLSEWFGAVANDSTDCTPYIQKAILAAKYVKAVRLLVGIYRITDTLELTETGFHLYGENRDSSVLKVMAQPSGDGFIKLNSGEPSARLNDFHIQYNQTDTATRGSLALTKPAIHAVAEPRFQIERLKISKVYDGIDMTGNSGGTYIKDVQMSALNIGIRIDGALDTVRIEDLHFWVFDLTANQITLFNDGTTVGIKVGRCDDLKITGCMLINQTCIYFTGAGTQSFASISDTDFDYLGMLAIDNGSIVRVSNCFFSKGANSGRSIECSNSSVLVSNCKFFAPITNTDVIYFFQDDASFEHVLSVSNCYFNTVACDVRSIYCYETGSGTPYVHINGNHFHRAPDQAMSVDTIQVVNNFRGSICNNSTRDAGTNSGDFINIDTDDYISVVGNMGIDWPINIPATFTAGTAGLNNPVAA